MSYASTMSTSDIQRAISLYWKALLSVNHTIRSCFSQSTFRISVSICYVPTSRVTQKIRSSGIKINQPLESLQCKRWQANRPLWFNISIVFSTLLVNNNSLNVRPGLWNDLRHKASSVQFRYVEASQEALIARGKCTYLIAIWAFLS